MVHEYSDILAADTDTAAVVVGGVLVLVVVVLFVGFVVFGVEFHFSYIQ